MLNQVLEFGWNFFRFTYFFEVRKMEELETDYSTWIQLPAVSVWSFNAITIQKNIMNKNSMKNTSKNNNMKKYYYTNYLYYSP